MIVSLICSETGEDIKYGTLLMAGTRSNLEVSLALSEEAIERIPEEERHPIPCEFGGNGINIHKASSVQNQSPVPEWRENYSWNGFKIGEFSFSITEEVAKKHLPNHFEHISKQKQKTCH